MAPSCGCRREAACSHVAGSVSKTGQEVGQSITPKAHPTVTHFLLLLALSVKTHMSVGESSHPVLGTCVLEATKSNARADEVHKVGDACAGTRGM